MRSVFVVLVPPDFCPLPGISQRQESRRAEQFPPQSGVERLDESVLRGRGRLQEVQCDVVEVRPLVEHPPGKLRTVVAADVPDRVSWTVVEGNHADNTP